MQQALSRTTAATYKLIKAYLKMLVKTHCTHLNTRAMSVSARKKKWQSGTTGSFWPAFLVFHHKSKLAAKLGGLASCKKDGDSNLDSFRCSLLRAFLSAFWSLTFMRRRPSGGIEPGHPSTSSRRSTWLERWHNSWFGRLSMNRIAQPKRPKKVKSEIKVL